uniref:Uncharacterized protein n=1 Tax=Rhizophora mucronata TaxID=61149 RepID=A0A2P2PS86_RHIMU
MNNLVTLDLTFYLCLGLRCKAL